MKFLGKPFFYDCIDWKRMSILGFGTVKLA